MNDQDKVVAWTSKKYIVATGAQGGGNLLVEEDVAGAYLEKYPNDLDLTEDDIPYISHIDPKPLVFCTEEDEKAAKECHNIHGGAGQSDPSSVDGTEESKKRCIESKGFGEGCCEVYTGCLMPDEDCEEITIVGRDECYWHVARLNQDADLCEKISDIYYKDKCLRDIIGTTQDSDTCEKITDISEKEDCYISLAIKNSDVSICGKITYNNEHRDKCYVNLAEHIGDTSICDKISEDSLKEKCYFWLAGEEGDVGVCEELEDSSLQNECYVNVAEKKSDGSFCDKITDSHIADKCYRDVGIQTNDRSLCEKIIEDRAKQKCLDNTSE